MNEDKRRKILGARRRAGSPSDMSAERLCFPTPTSRKSRRTKPSRHRAFVAYVVARELVVSADNDVSHASAMDRHQMLLQLQLKERLREALHVAGQGAVPSAPLMRRKTASWRGSGATGNR